MLLNIQHYILTTSGTFDNYYGEEWLILEEHPKTVCNFSFYLWDKNSEWLL